MFGRAGAIFSATGFQRQIVARRAVFRRGGGSPGPGADPARDRPERRRDPNGGAGLDHARGRAADVGRLAPGGKAELILFKGRSLTELLSRPESRRTLIRDGKLIDATVPDYHDLDDLMER